MIATIPYIERKFREYNKLMFDGVLPEIPIKLSKARTSLGQLAFKRKRTWWGKVSCYDFRLRVSIRFDLPEQELEDVIIHEMIHYYIYVRKLNDKSAHGPVFRRIMAEINEKYGRNVSISRKLKDLPLAAAGKAAEKGPDEYERYCREQAMMQEEEFDEERCFPEMPEGQFVRGH